MRLMRSMLPVFEAPADGGGTPPAAAPPAPWHAGNAELTGYLQNRGWHEKPANEVAALAITAHREAEKFIGAPADKMIRLPTNMADTAAMADVFKRLGMPAEPKDYDFANVKLAGDKSLDAKLDGALRTAAHAAQMPKDAATRFVAGLAKHLDAVESEALAERTAKLADEREVLRKSWGNHETANKLIAQNAAQTLGIKPEVVAALENAAGYAAVMQMFHLLGTKIGEDKYLGGGNPSGGPAITSREQAQSRLGELKSDTEWTKRYLNGDTVAAHEMSDLVKIIDAR